MRRLFNRRALAYGLIGCAMSGLLLSASARHSSPSARVIGGTPQGRSGLELALRSRKQTHSLSEEIILEVFLINRSRSAIYLRSPLRWAAGAGLSLAVRHAVGPSVLVTVLADSVAPPPRSRDEFISLFPSHIYGVLRVTTAENINIARTGRYELVADYQSPVPAKMSFGLPISANEHGRVYSNAVTITITD